MGLPHNCFHALFVNLLNYFRTLNKKYEIEKVKEIIRLNFYECIYFHVPTMTERFLELDYYSQGQLTSTLMQKAFHLAGGRLCRTYKLCVHPFETATSLYRFTHLRILSPNSF